MEKALQKQLTVEQSTFIRLLTTAGVYVCPLLIPEWPSPHPPLIVVYVCFTGPSLG